jgi:ribosome-binding ATPase YchF (GTP1/OBG family)
MKKQPTPMGILLASLERRIDKFEKLLKSEQMSDKNRYVLKNIKKELESFRDGIKTKLLPMEEEAIISAYRDATLEQCKDIPILFNESELEITEDEKELIEITSVNYYKDKYDNNTRG